MRLTADEVKQGLLHPEQLVRDAALRYFSESFSRDPSVMPLAIQAVETCGWDDAFEFASCLRDLVQTEQTFGWLIDQMKRVGYPETPQEQELCLRLSAIITNSDATLLAPKPPAPRVQPPAHAKSDFLSVRCTVRESRFAIVAVAVLIAVMWAVPGCTDRPAADSNAATATRSPGAA
ncbi:MAG: hypothetical protein WBF17_16845, partial [Phycisphaerae bacterium]